MKTKLAILGIDGATYDIIRPLIAQGDLPHIAHLLAHGASSELESTSPPITPPAWVSMMTGVNPGKHGVYHFLRRQRQSYELKLVDSTLFSGKDLFSIFSRRGWTVGGISVPMTFPPYPVNGYMLSGIPMPMTGSQNAYPEKMWDELTDFLGKPYTPDVDYAKFEGKKEPSSENIDRYAELRDQLFQVERERIDIMIEWLKRDPSEFFFAVLSVTDRCQHYFWKFMDRTHAGWSAEGERRFKDVIADSYRLADEALGRIREVIGEQCPIALVSDHGFGAYKSDFHVNRWLEDEGFLSFKKIPRWTLAGTNLKDLLIRVRLGKIARSLPVIIGKLPLVRPKLKRYRDHRDIDMSKTTAFAAMYGICINLVGREAQGLVNPGAEKDALIADIISRLQQIKNPASDEPLVDFAKAATELFCGEHLDMAPDVLYMLDGLNCLQNEDLDASVHITTRKYAAVSGTHRMNGIFAVAGCGVKENVEFAGMHIQDTAPTLLHLVGQAIPSSMEGALAEEAFDGKWLESNPAQFSADEESTAGSAVNAWTTEESESVQKSLEGLGYL
jgi:predicted AlkP superfamily phosphohydrolase/phosphomutase